MSVTWRRNLTFDKDPDSVLDYTLDFTNWLVDTDTISTIVVTADTGITVDSSSNTTTTATAWLSGGTAGTAYDVTYHVNTAGGRQVDRTIRIRVREH